MTCSANGPSPHRPPLGQQRKSILVTCLRDVPLRLGSAWFAYGSILFIDWPEVACSVARGLSSLDLL